MNIEVTECPHCGARVVLLSTGVCPACRKNSQGVRVATSQGVPVPTPQAVCVATSQGVAHPAAWDAYQESLRRRSDAPVGASLSQIEQQFAELRTTAIAHLGADPAADSAAAARIFQELLPRLAVAVEQMRVQGTNVARKNDETSVSLEYAEMRAESWRLLADALLQNDASKLQQHLTLWDRSEMFMVDLVWRKPASISSREPAPEKRIDDFQRALATFTPRLITTPVIVAANLLVFAVTLVAGAGFLAPATETMVEWGANYGPKTLNGQWWRLASSTFLHFGCLHLFFNMWVLWGLGRLVERLVGNVAFALLYFVSGIAGSIASLAWNPTIVSAGASGAVFGVAGALLGLIAFRRDSVPAVVLKPLRGSMAGFLFYNLAFGLVVSNIDMAAHIGGLAAGFVVGLLMSQPLSAEMVARRKFRNGLVFALGLIVLPLAAWALPKAPPDVIGELRRFGELEQRVIDTNNALVERARQGAVSDTEFADTMNRDILAPWIEARRGIEGLLDKPSVNRDELAQLVEYMKSREESWQLRIDGLREHDPTKLQRADEKWTEADQMLSKVSAR